MTARLFLMAVVALVSACAAGPGQNDVRAADAMHEALATTRASLAATGAHPDARPAATVRRRLPGQPPPNPAEHFPAHAQALIGAASGTIRATLGSPDLIRTDGPAEVWLYRGESCLLDVMLYRDRASGEGRVAHAQARAAGISGIAETECLREIAANPPPSPGITSALTRTTGRAF